MAKRKRHEKKEEEIKLLELREMKGVKISPPEPLLQKHLEEFARTMRLLRIEKEVPAHLIAGVEYHSLVTQAALSLGWIKNAPKDFGEVPAGLVIWISGVVSAILAEAQEIPKNWY